MTTLEAVKEHRLPCWCGVKEVEAALAAKFELTWQQTPWVPDPWVPEVVEPQQQVVSRNISPAFSLLLVLPH